ncbi:MAG: type II toxin-antitoxin system RelE/ParE family toxin [Candidatus Marinimicrobia bacterium]|nr:type II toxin-antitoxin system RelE/ParE family toxin [Candidatus Neomarinimicrobiota bacterium]
MYQVKQTSCFKKDFSKLDHRTQHRLLEKIALLAKGCESELDIKKLRGVSNLFRLRSGNYRILYQKFQDRLLIILIKARHRKDVYR